MKLREVRIRMCQKLKSTREPFALRVADIMALEQVSDEQVITTLSDCVIELESLKNKYLRMVSSGKLDDNNNQDKQ